MRDINIFKLHGLDVYRDPLQKWYTCLPMVDHDKNIYLGGGVVTDA